MRNCKLVILSMLLCCSLYMTGQEKFSKGDHFAPVNGIQIHYYVSGSGPCCIVPSPGWGPSIDYLKNSLIKLEKYFTFIYYDTRKTGQSTGPDDPTQYTSRIFMKDLDGLRQYLGLSKVWLLGHSSGGFQVLNYGIHHNSRINGIIALSAFAGLDELREEEFNAIILKHKDFPDHQKGYFILSGKDTTRYSADERMQYILPYYFHDTRKMKEFQEVSTSPLSHQAGEYTTASGLGLEYILPELRKIRVPVLVVVGDDDFICDKVSQSDRIAANIKNSTEIVIENAGHFSWIEQPVQFFSECTEWLRKMGLKENP